MQRYDFNDFGVILKERPLRTCALYSLYEAVAVTCLSQIPAAATPYEVSLACP